MPSTGTASPDDARAACIARHGYAASETAAAFARARDLVEAVGDVPQQFPVLYGFWAVQYVRMAVREQQNLAGHILALAEQHPDPERLCVAHRICGATNEMMGELPAAKREAVAHLQAVMGLSERRACSFVGADRKMVRYRSRRPPETELRGRLRDLANERRRFGYRRLFILLRREGEPSGVNRIYRLYREEGLTVRKRRARRRAVGTRAPILVEAKAECALVAGLRA